MAASAMLPPPPPDLEAVYRPDEDMQVRGTILAELADEATVPVLTTTFEEVLGLPRPPPPPPPPKTPLPKPVSQEEAFEDVLGLRPRPAQGPLLNLLGSSEHEASAGTMPAEAATEGGLLEQLPAGISPTSLEKNAALVNLSVPTPGKEQLEPPPSPRARCAAAGANTIGPQALRSTARAIKSSTATGGSRGQVPVAPRLIPKDAKGFGSDDLIGNGSREKTLKDEAVTAISTVYGMLPDPVKDQAKPFIPSCIEPPDGDKATEEVMSPRYNTEVPTPSDNDAAGLLGRRASGLEAEHTQAAVDRACNGKWVPTYMRHQLAQNGHISLPTAPNAHEHSATVPPPSLGQAFVEMGEEFGESAQTMFTLMLAFLSSLATQCQLCTHQAATTVHDQVVTYGENICSGEGHQDEFEERIMLGRPVDETVAGLGPVRSQLRDHVQVSFTRLAEIAKRKLVTPEAPPQFQQFIRARELLRQVVVQETAVEDWLFSTEIRKEVLPEGTLPHLCPSLGPFAFHETWHVEMREERAEVEMSSSPAHGPVTVVLRLVINGKPSSEGGGCDVESRVFARPWEHGTVLPLGLVEQLTQVHKTYASSLCGAVLALDKEMEHPGPGTDKPEGPAIAKGSDLLPVVQLSLPEKFMPSWKAESSASGKRGAADCAVTLRAEKSGGVDAALLMQVADGI